MDIEAILKQLRTELDTLNEGIIAIERIAVGDRRRRGRPPKWLSSAKATAPAKRRGRPPGNGKYETGKNFWAA